MKLTDFALPGDDDSKCLNADERKLGNDVLAHYRDTHDPGPVRPLPMRITFFRSRFGGGWWP